MGDMANADNTAPTSGEEVKEEGTIAKVHGDAKSQFINAGKRDSDELYIASGRPEDKATAIHSEDSRYFSCLSKTESVKRGGDPAQWAEYRKLQDLVVALQKVAGPLDRVLNGEKIRDALRG